MRGLAIAALAAAAVGLPAVSMAPAVKAAASCTAWTSTVKPPPTIRVLRSATNKVAIVDFESYVKVVMPAEWPAAWSLESLRAGAVAIKQYAWYYTMHYRGGTGTGGCYDVADNANDQVYKPETYTPAASHIQAVESTWSESIVRNGTSVFTGYRSGTNVACGTDADGAHLWQRSSLNCALAGKTGEEILQIYYGPGLTIQAPTTYHPLTPTRILDSRDGYWIGLAGAFSSHVARTFHVSGVGGVPGNAVAVTGNLTVTSQTAAGFLYVGPDAMNDPTSSTLNFPVGDDRANSVTLALGAGGTLAATYASPTLGDTAQVIFDVTGFFTPDTSGATYHALTPSRVLDSRDGYWIGLAGAFSSHVARTFAVAGVGGVPANATAVTGNLTVTGQTAAGFVYLGPNAANDPTSSTLNFPIGDDRANAVTVALGPGGTLSATYAAPTLGQTAQVIFDVTGYFTPDASGATYQAVTPSRILDSRDGYWIGLAGAFSSHVARTFTVIGHGGVPGSAIAVTGNLTVTDQTAAGFLYVGPVPVNDPATSTLNFPVGDDRANAVTVALGAGGMLSVTYAASTTGPTAQAIFDVTGYFSMT